MKPILAATTATLALIAASPAFAQAQPAETGDPRDESDERTIVVTGALTDFGATKSDTPIVETARSISIETEQDFEEKGAQSLDDALTYSAGVTAEPFGFSTRGDFAQVRGLDAPEYRDNLQYLFGFYNTTRQDIYTLEQVEVLKGPASVLYGAGSPGGIINVVTKRPHGETEGEVRLDYGSFDRKQIATDINVAIPGAEDQAQFRFVGILRDADTQIDEVNDDKLVLAPALTLRPATGTEVTILANYSKQDSDTAHQFLPVTGTLFPSASGQEIDPYEYMGAPGFNAYDTESFALTLLLEQQLSDVFSVEAVGRYVDSVADYRQAWIAFQGNGVPRIDADGNGAWTYYLADNRSEQLALDARLRGEFSTGPIEHELLVGVQAQDVFTDSDTAYVFNAGTLNVFDPQYQNVPSVEQIRQLQGNGPRNFVDSTGIYISDQMSWGSLVANAGVRFDDVSNRVENGTTQKDDATSLSFGLLWRGPAGISPYASYAESFEPVVGIDTVTNQQLLPQEGRQYEAGIKWQPTGINALVTASVFDIEVSNLPNPNSLVGGNSQQEGVSKVRGAELEANALIGGLRIDGNVSYLDAEDPNGLPLTSISDWQASLFALYNFRGALDGLSLGGGIRYVGGNESNGLSAIDGSLLTYRVDGRTVGDLSIGYDFDRFALRLTARNVTDEEYYAVCLVRGDCFPGEKRSINGSLTVAF
ncbi:TonB-dependent siderophore receptor [Alteriqipengyuania lutimaris]|uniref:TonB-dependent siderophore receptor n=1 Tax=Alteriqipengyuania lutimaris TaxID=1538146 RepID=A0A395LP06_9SPHN|nr:TonB-dependent siderophore receptor [Alteriqipengyuania lutimaris]MBB3032440.1 iron complex outermembrane receptor protein [Alteriqipengyuania lutimaris]RDS78419.1 TonB-dependent siderophore receptor [Alteriqipengyuania lutimaris]